MTEPGPGPGCGRSSGGRPRAGRPRAAGHLRAAAAAVAGCLLALAVACGGAGSAPGHRQTRTPATASAAAPTARAPSAPSTPGATGAGVPAFRHVVVVVMENHAYHQVIGNPAAPFINGLALRGALFTRSYAVSHPSQPNYLALFSGSAQGITDDSCPHTLSAPNLAAGLAGAGKSFTGYAEGLPAPGSTVCGSGGYARKHAPWVNFPDVPAADSQPFSSFPAGDLAALPTVAWVIPDLCHDMHDCGVATGDQWLRQHLAGYAQWATSHQSLLILTWDEDDRGSDNHIVTVLAGQFVRPGRYAQRITHYDVLATIEAAYGLPRDGGAASAAPITGIWTGG